MTKQIQLSQGKVALVDDTLFDYLDQWKWTAEQRENTWYAKRNVQRDGRNRKFYMHRVVAGASAGELVDHVNGDGLNNQAYNLRLCTNSQNQFNKTRNKDNKSGYKGVRWDGKRKSWRSKIYKNKKAIHLGYFTNPIEAAEAYDKAARELFGEFAKTNFK